MTAPPINLVPVGLAMVFAAGLIRGFTGFGFNVAAMPLLSLIIAPAQAVPVVLLLQFFVSASGLRAAAATCDWRSVRLLALGSLVSTPLGVWALSQLPASAMRLCIAAIVLVAVLPLSGGLRLKRKLSTGTTLLFGVVSGLFNGLGGMPGPPVVAFYLATPIGSAVARASMIVFFLATSMVALVPLVAFGMVPGWDLVAAALGVPFVLLGSAIGARLYKISSETQYRRVSLGLLVVTGLLAATRALVGFHMGPRL